MADTRTPAVDLDANPEQFGQTTARTIFTDRIGEAKILLEPKMWVTVKLRLETAGPVAIGINNANIIPVLNGLGSLLGADEITIVLKKGDRLFYGCNAINRVRMVTEPVPWQQQIFMRIGDVIRALSGSTPSTPTAPPAPLKPSTRKIGNVRGRRW
jgi:hypothetical protein